MKGKFYAVDRSYLALRDGFEIDITQAMPHHRGGSFRAEIMLVPPAGVVAMPVRDERARHRSPGVDIDIRLRTVNASFGEFQEFHVQSLLIRLPPVYLLREVGGRLKSNNGTNRKRLRFRTPINPVIFFSNAGWTTNPFLGTTALASINRDPIVINQIHFLIENIYISFLYSDNMCTLSFVAYLCRVLIFSLNLRVL